MERLEAIKWLKRIRTRQTGGKDEYDNARREAIDMACDALAEGTIVVTRCEDCEHYRDKSNWCVLWNRKTIPVGYCHGGEQC